MDQELELIHPILEILEIEVSNILYIVLGILEISFFLISHILEILKSAFFQFLIWWKYWRRAGGSRG